ncbi:phosphotransferase [Candidatus Vidania fulgoroideorum]
MSVFTNLKFDILSVINKKYNLTFINIKTIKEGTDNSNFFIKTKKNVFILTIFENINKVSILKCLKFMELLNINGIKTPFVLLNINNKKISKIFINGKKKYYSILSKIKGLKVNISNKAICRRIGLFINKVHCISKNNLVFIQNRNSFKELKKKINALKGLLSEEYFYLINEEYNYHNFSLYYDILPQGICHCDIFMDNIFFSNDKKYISGIIDFYFSCFDFFLLDLSTILNVWCLKGEKICKDMILLFFDYYKICLKPCEILYLSNVLRLSSLKFLITRLYNLNVNENKSKKKISFFKNILVKHIKNSLFYNDDYKKN